MSSQILRQTRTVEGGTRGLSCCNLTDYFLNPSDDELVAVVVDGREVSYGQLRAHVCLARQKLQALGAGRGDRILICLPDGIGFLGTWFAAQSLGMVTAEVASDVPRGELSDILAYVKPSLLVTDRLDVACGPWRRVGLDELASESLQLAPVRQVPCETVTSDQIVIWKFTSGSTGRPKACLLPAIGAIHVFEGLQAAGMGVIREDVVLPVPNLHFGYARDLAALFPFRVGATSVIYSRKCTRSRLDELMAAHRPTVLVNVPVMMSKILAESDLDLYRSLRRNYSAGDHLPAHVRQGWSDLTGVSTVNILGASEAYHAYLVHADELGTDGFLPLPGTDVRLVTSGGREAGQGEIGRIQVTSPAVARGYWDTSAEGNADFGGDGSWQSRDLGKAEEDGSVSFVGRLGRMAKVNGQWVNPVDVEGVLLSDPLVQAAAVFPAQSEDETSRLVAAVVAHEAFCPRAAGREIERRLGRLHVPTEFQRLRELPEQRNGKIDYASLAGS